MKKFFGEFKKFITRGNVLDMAVGVIVGSAFTAIVNGLSNYVLKPLINWLLALVFGANSLDGIVTYLKKAFVMENGVATETIDLANSIYIDWGAVINAVINFLLVALVLFTIVKLINSVREKNKELSEKLQKGKLTKEQKKELKANMISRKDKEAVKAYFEAKEKAEAEEKARVEAEEKAKAEEERKANPTTEDLLKQILAELQKKN